MPYYCETCNETITHYDCVYCEEPIKHGVAAPEGFCSNYCFCKYQALIARVRASDLRLPYKD